MGVTLLHYSLKLSYTEGLASQVFSAHSLTPGAAKPASDLKSACTNQHLMGQPPVCPCHWCQHWNAEEESNPLAGQGRLKTLNVKGWAGLLWMLSALDKGPGGPTWRGPGTELVTLPEVPGAGTSQGHCCHRPRGGCRVTRVTLHHVAVTCKTTQWPNILRLYTKCSTEEVKY